MKSLRIIVKALFFVIGIIALGIVIFNNVYTAFTAIIGNSMLIFYFILSVIFASVYAFTASIKIKPEFKL